MKMEFKHYSVLLDETIEQLNTRPDGIYVDGTLGGGGHKGVQLGKIGQGALGIKKRLPAAGGQGIQLLGQKHTKPPGNRLFIPVYHTAPGLAMCSKKRYNKIHWRHAPHNLL